MHCRPRHRQLADPRLDLVHNRFPDSLADKAAPQPLRSLRYRTGDVMNAHVVVDNERVSAPKVDRWAVRDIEVLSHKG